MLKSYEALYENGEVKWLSEKPEVQTVRVIITLLEEVSPASEPLSKAKQAAHALAQLGGSEPDLEPIPRRRWDAANADHG